MREGLIVEFLHQGCAKWVVVNVNDCRATIIPMTGKNPDDPSEVYEETHPGATGISPTSECRTFGYVKGQVRKREYRPAVPRSVVRVPVERPKVKQVLMEALPSIPEDPMQVDPVIAAVLTSTRDFLSLGSR
jgi:hypothetical protein